MSEPASAPGKRKRNPSSRLADESNNGEFVLSTHRSARARAIEEEHSRQAAAELASASNNHTSESPDVTSTSALVTPALSHTSSIAGINISDGNATSSNTSLFEAVGIHGTQLFNYCFYH